MKVQCVQSKAPEVENLRCRMSLPDCNEPSWYSRRDVEVQHRRQVGYEAEAGNGSLKRRIFGFWNALHQLCVNIWIF